MEALEDLLEIDPGWPCTFQQYFHAFKEIHLRQDLRRLYVDKEFPENVERFELGGPFTDLEHKAIRFVKRDSGWVLVDIVMYR